MAALKPWYTVISPREDLRQNKPLDTAQFAVNLDDVRTGRADEVYRDAQQFFERTYLTNNLLGLAVEVARRLDGQIHDANAVFNLATQFGGGKTHALTLLYHLARGGSDASHWAGVSRILDAASVRTMPNAAVAVFVGQKFDSTTGRGGGNEPVRRTPWGEIAWQLGPAAWEAIAPLDEEIRAPGGDAIGAMLSEDRPSLILMDELLNYVSRYRNTPYAPQFYNFVHNLTEEARGRRGVVVAVSIPASELEMSPEDERDYQQYKKVLDRLGKPVLLSAEGETAEIIRRRLFEWTGLPEEGKRTSVQFADWTTEHQAQLAERLGRDKSQELFRAAYPFHPTLLSVFERKWQQLPRFQRTRGVLLMLARWVAHAYQDDFKGRQTDPLIDLGSAPLDDLGFRTAVFEQLGESRLEGAVTADIAGRANSHAIMLDDESPAGLRNARVHRKVASAIFFESNGGQLHAEASIPEIRAAVGGPNLDIGDIEGALEQLIQRCYYLSLDRNKYRFGTRENLNKRHADTRANVTDSRALERIQDEILKVFNLQTARREFPNAQFNVILAPATSSGIPDAPELTLVVMSPNQPASDPFTKQIIETFTMEHGASPRSFKNALIWCIPEDTLQMRDAAKKLLAWEDVRDELNDVLPDNRLDDVQERQLREYLHRTAADLRESVWRAYRNVVVLSKTGSLRWINLGQITSSAAATLIGLILNRLITEGEVTESVSPNHIVRNWPPTFTTWDLRAIRDAFFASPLFSRLLNSQAIRDTVSLGVKNGMFAYVSLPVDPSSGNFFLDIAMNRDQIEISDGVGIIRRQDAEAALNADKLRAQHSSEMLSDPDSDTSQVEAGRHESITSEVDERHDNRSTAMAFVKSPMRLSWSGDITTQKWQLFYNKVISRFVTGNRVQISVTFVVEANDGISSQKIDETRIALRELGLEVSLHLEGDGN